MPHLRSCLHTRRFRRTGKQNLMECQWIWSWPCEVVCGPASHFFKWWLTSAQGWQSTLAHTHATLPNNTKPHRFESKLQRLIKTSLSSYWPPIRGIRGPRMNPSNLQCASWIWFSVQLNLNPELNHESTSLPHKSGWAGRYPTSFLIAVPTTRICPSED